MRIQLRNITKYYKHTAAVNCLNMEIKDGEFLVVLGSSGSGKTTTLNMIAGLETPTSGDIYFNDNLVNTVPPGKRDIALVFQNYALYPHMKIFDNIAFPLRIRKAKDLNENVENTARMLGINNLLQKYPKELSGGEKQRVALARALVRNPQVFLMDEPLSNLDARLRISARGELKKLQKQRNVTTVYVTHDQTEALTLGDRIAVMDKGHLQQIRTPYEIYNAPQNTFIAGFVGAPAMNFAEVRLITASSFALGETILESPVPPANTPQVILGIRPEKLQCVSPDFKNAIKSIVEHIEYLGHESVCHVRISPDILWSVKNTESTVSVGDLVGLAFSPDAVHWFDQSTGMRILDRSVNTRHT
ncbi:trehalose/maltose import ATP-binding protein MalK [Candidatus Kuenenia stuttgartiensis]|uniref:Trehalose/maltose import ATP-binding protein MalK n=1 Tax=Kuenenia stuttgartiensis TaxID=174633 RepID=A0A6G7GK60_KUEST|nr:ABC transporter ATP-binding protein [Candidatus Kuenenia stuttgartiensis]QII09734.1 trehalose/maltose import ATP-binding protein MalK [Candidatus Kuenenia stuttgartiensis]